MDRGQFDTLARLVSVQQSRRSALAAILGAALLRHDAATALAKDRGKGKARAKAKATTKPCLSRHELHPWQGEERLGM
jgi:hypothetical protein